MVCEPEKSVKLDIYVGSRIGTFKHIKYDSSSNTKKKQKNTSRHLQDVKSLEKGQGISCLAWRDKEQTSIIIGRKERYVQTYDLLSEQFMETKQISCGTGKINSICGNENSTILGLDCGIVNVWNSTTKDDIIIDTGGILDRLVHCKEDIKVIATGGKENQLRLWDLETKLSTFEAKNVAHDWLQLRVPIWVSDACFLPDGQGKVIATCSRYGVVRLYDARAQRRPVCSVEFKEQANTCITVGNGERQVVVGTGRGILQVVDLRAGRPDKSFKGAVGSITAIAQHQSSLLSTSLDRHLRIHDPDSKQLLHKQYLTTKLTCLLVRTASVPLPSDEDVKLKEEDEVEEPVAEESGDEDDPEYDELFQNMEVIGDETVEFNREKKSKNKKSDAAVKEESSTTTPASRKARKSKLATQDETKTPSKKRKSSAAESATPSKEEPVSLDESIKQLLKSTEKAKRRIEKKKREKKAKSLFSN